MKRAPMERNRAMRNLIGKLVLAAGLTVASLPAAFAEDVDVTFLLISDIYEMAKCKGKTRWVCPRECDSQG